ncbi:MAG TPA: T9SS type A sorting domain-containing protein, partial [Bacteroidetes bacterium]|nr:T9SS type A sorting domain-containing protein [Bacteroidota bacterium]
TEYALHQNYPNPFNPVTEIKFDLVKPQVVKLAVYNVLGQEVARVVDRRMEAGYHRVSFDASSLSSGVYFYRIETAAFTDLKKMVLIK